ncbi:hypothetical protein LMG29542_05256 [Paraburkholderia humisilvae]|uniref:Uncharacterized protein n=1 Tax=Paraburkholderia humisilvae TaxID=627669 RepID=A0A6J5EKU5_9BURK|nr:hypothetical protein LMG29542_05256 [Paraburkholderia humisilvae]
MIVASTSVPSFIIKPRSHSEIPISSNSRRVRSCISNRRRNFSKVVASGTFSTARSIPAQVRIAMLSYSASSRPSSDSPYHCAHEVHAQHALQPDRRPPPRALGIVRFKRFEQTRPRHDAVHLGQKALSTRHALLAGAFRFRKTDLPLHSICQVCVREAVPAHEEVLAHVAPARGPCDARCPAAAGSG